MKIKNIESPKWIEGHWVVKAQFIEKEDSQTQYEQVKFSHHEIAAWWYLDALTRNKDNVPKNIPVPSIDELFRTMLESVR